MLELLWRIRVLCFYALVSTLTIVFFVLFVLPIKVLNLNYNARYSIAVIFSYGFVWLGRLICGLKYQVTGLEKLPPGPCIVMANHQSFWDNVFMQLIIPKHSWIIKRELFNIPFFGWGLKILEPIAVDRSYGLSVKQILREGQKKIAQGLWLIIFPESTRLRPDQQVKFKPSAVKLALTAKVPIVLLAHNAGVFWPKGFWMSKPGTISVKIIDVITFEEMQHLEVRSLSDKVEQIINTEKQILFEQTLNA